VRWRHGVDWCWLNTHLFHGRKCQISRRFWQKCQISRKFHGRLFVVLWNPQTIYLHWYMRPICVNSKQSTLKMSPTVILLFIDMLTGYLRGSTFTCSITCSVGKLQTVMATVQTYTLTGTEPSPLPYKTTTKQWPALSPPLLVQFSTGNYKFLGSIIRSLRLLGNDDLIRRITVWHGLTLSAIDSCVLADT